MTAFGKFAVSCLIVAGGVLIVRHGAMALHPARPADMPANAYFVQSGYNLDRNEPTGDWIACRINQDASADFCRVTDAHGTVIYQGEFLPADGSAVLATNDIHIATRDDTDLWVNGPAEDAPVPVIPLANGKILVPSDDAYALSYRWSHDPDQLRRIQASNQGV